MFILKSQVNWRMLPEYYRGKTYQYHYEIYPVVTTYAKEAKVYKSRKIAEKSFNILNNKINSGHKFNVIEIKEE